jgi:hypothetical protein
LVLSNILFLFHSAAIFQQLTVVDKEAMAAQRKKTMECGGISASQCPEGVAARAQASISLECFFDRHLPYLFAFVFMLLVSYLSPFFSNSLWYSNNMQNQQHILNSSFGPPLRFSA